MEAWGLFFSQDDCSLTKTKCLLLLHYCICCRVPPTFYEFALNKTVLIVQSYLNSKDLCRLNRATTIFIIKKCCIFIPVCHFSLI